MTTSEKEGVTDSLVDALAPSQFFAGEYRVSTKWIRRFAISQGILALKIGRESLYPRGKLLAALAAIEPGRLERIQNRFSSSSCRPKELLVPEGFATAKDIAELYPSLTVESVLRRLSVSSVARVKIHRRKLLAYRLDEAKELLDEAMREHENNKHRIELLERQAKEKARKRELEAHRTQLGPLLKLPPLDKFREVVREFERTNPWR